MNDDTLYGWIAPGTEQAVPGRDDVQLRERPAGRRLGRAARRRSARSRTARRRSPRPRPTTARARRRRSSCACSPSSATSRSTARPVAGFNPDVTNYDVDRCRPASPTCRSVSGDGADRHGRRSRRRGVPGVGDGHLDRAGRHRRRRTRSTSRSRRVERRVRRRRARPEVDGRPRDAGDWSLHGRRRLADDHAGDRRPHDDDEHGEEPRAPAGARRLDDDDEADLQRTPERRDPAGRDHRVPGRRQLPEVRPRGDVGDEHPVQHDARGHAAATASQVRADAEHDERERDPPGEQHDLAADDEERATSTRRSTRSTATRGCRSGRPARR